jgi:DNA polymerase
LTAPVVLVGESPAAKCMGAVPFTGGSERILVAALTRARRTRDDVFITNTIHCHPPGDRDPLPEEITKCRRYLRSELNIVRPRLVIGLGKTYVHPALRSIYPDALELTPPFRVPRLPKPEPEAGDPLCLLFPHPRWIMTRAAPMRDDYQAALARALRWGFREP